MANLGPNFYPKLVQMASEVGMKPEDLIAVMISESGMNPQAVEQKFKGSGLVGFMPDTLTGLGFHGTWEDFTKLNGEQQLDYVKKLVQNFTKLSGKPISSAAQYYCANFWPVSLKLPGVQAGNPSTAFIEARPAIVTDPKTGQKWSKKYYDIGMHISAAQESNAYKYNPLFDKDKKGAITYGDMMKQVDKIKQSLPYKKALIEIQKATNYKPGKESRTMTTDKDDIITRYLKQHRETVDPYKALQDKSVPLKPVAPTVPGLESTITQYLDKIKASEKLNKYLYKQYLPLNHLVISVKAANFVDAVEFSHILCAALDEELMATGSIHTDDNTVEVECAIHGPANDCFETVKQLTSALAAAFKSATIKIGGIEVKTQFSMNKKSSYQQIDIISANTQHRKFLLKFV